MKSPLRVGWLLAASALLWACAVSPPSRLESYLGPIPTGGASLSGPSEFEAGLLVINDTTARDSAPALLDPAMQFVTVRTQQRIGRDLPIKIVKLLRADPFPPGREPSRVMQLAREQGVKYLVVAIFSSAESEVPATHEHIAYDMLRGVTADEALEQAVMHLREAWSRAS